MPRPRDIFNRQPHLDAVELAIDVLEGGARHKAVQRDRLLDLVELRHRQQLVQPVQRLQLERALRPLGQRSRRAPSARVGGRAAASRLVRGDDGVEG